MSDDIQWRRAARISADGVYRLRLSRFQIGGNGRVCVFIMLNPSTADGEVDDATIRRCMAFALRFNCGWLIVVNLFDLRSRMPAMLWEEGAVPVSAHWQDNLTEAMIDARVSEGHIIAAWGTDPNKAPKEFKALRRRQIECVCKMAKQLGVALQCLEVPCQDGSPRHPLYLRSGALLGPWPQREVA